MRSPGLAHRQAANAYLPCSPITQQAVRMKCGRCGAETQDGVGFCATCGNDLSAPTDRRCPGCGRMVQLSYVACPFCGRSLTLQPSYGVQAGTGGSLTKHLRYMSGVAVLVGLYFVFWGVWDVWTMGYYDYIDGWIVADTLLAFIAGLACIVVGLQVLTTSTRA